MRLSGLVIALWLAAQPAQSACRQALALALDVSGSVSGEEYRLQLSGLATALGDPAVVSALLSAPETPVALAVFEWSSSKYQNVVQGWTLIDSPDALNTVRARLVATRRAPAPQATGLGAAMEYGARLLNNAPDCWKRTLDISGDGKNNDWPRPREVRARGSAAGILINGLVIAPDTGSAGGQATEAGELAAYFQARVIQGPDAFVEVAFGFEDFAEAMRRKLLRELQTRPVGSAPDVTPKAVLRADLGAATENQ